ncbi:hypothetical protein L195_g061250, partial [Trifolium pratense]
MCFVECLGVVRAIGEEGEWCMTVCDVKGTEVLLVSGSNMKWIVE